MKEVSDFLWVFGEIGKDLSSNMGDVDGKSQGRIRKEIACE